MRQKTVRVFEYDTGAEMRVSYETAHALVKQAKVNGGKPAVQVSRDLMLKDSKGRVTHEIYDAREFIDWMAEHPEDLERSLEAQ